MDTVEKVVKKVICSERSNLFEPNVYISMLVQLEGKIDTGQIEQAVQMAYVGNEVTMSKVVLEENGIAYYEKLNKSGCKVFVDNCSWKEIIRESEKKPFSINEGEFVRTYIISDSRTDVKESTNKKSYTILIMAHHLVGDGKSILILIEDIIRSLDGKKITYKPIQLLSADYLEEKTSFSLATKLWIKKVNKKWEKIGRTFSWEDYFHVHRLYWENKYSDIEIKTFSGKELKEKKKFCPQGVTLNSYLTAELVQEYPDCKIIGIPIDVRKDNKSMSNQVGGIRIKHQYQRNKSIEENSKAIHRKIYHKLTKEKTRYFVLLLIAKLLPSLVDAILLNTHGYYQNSLAKRVAYIMGYQGNGGTQLGITNLTRIEIPNQYEHFSIQNIQFIPPKVSYSENVVGICTYGDCMNVSYHRMGEE